MGIVLLGSVGAGAPPTSPLKLASADQSIDPLISESDKSSRAEHKTRILPPQLSHLHPTQKIPSATTKYHSNNVKITVDSRRVLSHDLAN